MQDGNGCHVELPPYIGQGEFGAEGIASIVRRMSFQESQELIGRFSD